MMTNQASTWLAAAPSMIVTLLVLIAPGGVAAWLAGLRGLAMIALAPGITVTAVVVGGVLAPSLGFGWGPATLSIVVAVLWLFAGATGWTLRRLPRASVDRSLVTGLIGVTMACLVVLAVVLPVTGSPDHFPQNPDTIFHLGTAQWMLSGGDISTVHAAGFSSASGTGFYPAAWHGMVVTISQLTHAPITVASASLALVTAGVIWPLSMVLLARAVFGPGLRVSLAAAVTSVTFSAFPYWLMGYGVLWPNLFGQALMPLALACLVILTRPSTAGPPDLAPGSGSDRSTPADEPLLLSRGHAGLGLVAILPGMGVAHPGAFVSFVLLGYLVLAGSLVKLARSARRERPGLARGAMAGLVIGSAVALAYWLATTAISPAMRASNPIGPETTPGKAALDLLAFSPRGQTRPWVIGALVLGGVVLVLVRGSGRRWVAAALFEVSLLYSLLTAVDSPLTRLLTWPWYNNSPRLASLIVLPAALCATAALVSLSAATARLFQRWPGRLSSTTRRTAAVVPTLVLVLITGGDYVAAHRKILHPYFHPIPTKAFVSGRELTALRTLATRIPPDAVVAANPWKGGEYLYVVSGRRMLFPTEKSLTSSDRTLLARHLDDAGRSVAVCAAARRAGVRYAITGGDANDAAGPQVMLYRGVDGVRSSPAFRQVTTATPYRLYKLVRCAGG